MPDVRYPPVTLFEYAADFLYVVDGDTADFRIDLGFRSTRIERVRLWGIDAPERGDEPGYSAAKSFLASVAERSGRGDSSVYLRTFRGDAHDSFGRYLASIIELPAGGEPLEVNGEMLRLGLAAPYRR